MRDQEEVTKQTISAFLISQQQQQQQQQQQDARMNFPRFPPPISSVVAICAGKNSTERTYTCTGNNKLLVLFSPFF